MSSQKYLDFKSLAKEQSEVRENGLETIQLKDGFTVTYHPQEILTSSKKICCNGVCIYISVAESGLKRISFAESYLVILGYSSGYHTVACSNHVINFLNDNGMIISYSGTGNESDLKLPIHIVKFCDSEKFDFSDLPEIIKKYFKVN